MNLFKQFPYNIHDNDIVTSFAFPLNELSLLEVAEHRFLSITRPYRHSELLQLEDTTQFYFPNLLEP